MALPGTRLQLVPFWGAGLVGSQGQSKQQVHQDGQKVSGSKSASASGQDGLGGIYRGRWALTSPGHAG